MSIKFEENIVPANVERTLGTVKFIKALPIRTVFEDGEDTGEIVERRAEFMSDIQTGGFIVTFPASVDLTNFSFRDVIKLTGVTFKPWSIIDAEAFGNFADSDVKVTAKGIEKVSMAKPAPAQPNQNNKDDNKTK